MVYPSDNEFAVENPWCEKRQSGQLSGGSMLGLLLVLLLSSSILLCAFSASMAHCETGESASMVEMSMMVCMMLAVVAGGITVPAALRSVYQLSLQIFNLASATIASFRSGLSPPGRQAAFTTPLRI